MRYAGQYQDDESGLHYNLFRYYKKGNKMLKALLIGVSHLRLAD
nr:hypothetical protein [Serratia ficaria]